MNDFDLTSALKIMNTVKAYFIFPINAKSGTSVYLLYGTRVRIKSYLSAQLLAVWFEKACIGFVKKGFITYHDSAGQFVWSMTVESSQWTNQEFVQEIGSSIYRGWKCNKLNLRMVQEIKAKSGKSGFSHKPSWLLLSFMHYPVLLIVYSTRLITDRTELKYTQILIAVKYKFYREIYLFSTKMSHINFSSANNVGLAEGNDK